MAIFGSRHALILTAAAASAFAAGPASACVIDVTSQVYMDACGSTANRVGGQGYYLDSSGTLQMTTTTDNGTTTAAAPSQTLGVPVAALSGSATETAHGASMSGSSRVSDGVNGSYNDIIVIDGNQVISERKLAANSVVPNLHASVSGSAAGGTTSSTGQSAADASFSDVISITAGQLAYVNSTAGKTLDSVSLQLRFQTHGTATASGNLPSGRTPRHTGSSSCPGNPRTRSRTAIRSARAHRRSATRPTARSAAPPSSPLHSSRGMPT